jgi:hypothetical protein
VAEHGDNAQTLATFLGIDYSEALKMLGDQGYVEAGNYFAQINEGDLVKLDNNYTKSLEKHASLPDGDPMIYYNCWGAAKAGVEGIDIKVGVGIPMPKTFDDMLTTDYTQVNSSEAKFGKTILRFTSATPYVGTGYDYLASTGDLSRDPNAIGGSLHGAIFYGKSMDGTIYIYTKNGWNEAPRIMKLSDLENNTYYEYGNVRGLGGGTGYYNKN